VNDQDARDRQRKLDLLELRKQLDARKYWQGEIKKHQSVLADPGRSGQHKTANELKAMAERALALTEEQISTVMALLNVEDDKDEIERQLAALDD
jgi:hypothetical protein